MTNKNSKTTTVDTGRRRLIGLAGTGTLAGMLGGLGFSATVRAQQTKTVRWGIVGTGGIANSMARSIKAADAAVIAAVSSRRMETARAFADNHSVENAFDSWQEMCEWDGVDAIYVATPTSVVVMAANAMIGVGIRLFGGGVFPEATSYWWCAVPVVVVGAPLGAWKPGIGEYI